MQHDEQLRLAERFHLRAVALARQGVLGRSLKTYVPALREAYVQWLSLLDNPEVPVLIYGERGTGKRKHAEEYFYLHNLIKSLQGEGPGKFKVFAGDFLDKGFTQLFGNPHTSSSDLIYLEKVDVLKPECQEELLAYLKLRREMNSKGAVFGRLFISTEKALSLVCVRGDFSKELFDMLTAFSIYLPNIQERSQDLPHLLVELLTEISGKKQLPPIWLVDRLSGRPFFENIDEMKKLLRNIYARKSDLSTWLPADLVNPTQSQTAGSFMLGKPEDATAALHEKKRVQSTLKHFRGDVQMAANELGVGRAEFLRKVLALGVRI